MVVHASCVGNSIKCRVHMVSHSVVDHETLQSKIDAVAAAGGGRVVVLPGRHLVGQLDLKSDIELHLEKGAVLEGRVGIENYRVTELPYSEGTWSAIVSAIGATNVAITGEGEIFGNGTAWAQPEDYGGNQEGLRPRGVFFANCRGVCLSDFTLRDSACWGVVFKCCENVDIRRLKIDNHANANNDGIDIEAKNVVIADCDIDAGDDAVCLKSNTPDFIVENVLVTNVMARSHCNALKLGTASHGTMRNVLFIDCRTEAPRRDYTDRRFGRNRKWYENEDRRMSKLGYDWREGGAATSGLCVENVDGGTVEDITYRNVDVRGVCVPIFVRAGTRTGRSCGTPPSDKYVFRDIVFDTITGEASSFVASSVTGVEGCRVKEVVLRNVRLRCKGAGGRSELTRMAPVPEVADKYPDAHMFGHILPAYGLYVRHVDDIRMENVSFELEKGTFDKRSQIVFDDVSSVVMPLNDGWTADGVPVTLPHCWNIEDGTDGPMDLKCWNHDSVAGTGYARRKVVYRRELPAAEKTRYLRVNAASIHAVVRVDGREVGRHAGAFTAFTVELPRGGKIVEIEVDNFYDPDVPPVCGDFTMYGGLYRGVDLLDAPETFPAPTGLPKYEIREDGFYVDGVKTFLKGVCYHQDREGKGWAISAEDEEEDIKLIKAMGANAIRTSHYPRSERFYDLCDKYGIYVWTEIPLVDATTASETFRSNTLNVAREMVLQHRHHKCIAMWGIFNELYLKKMPDGQAEPLVREVKELIRSLDPRPIVAASNNPKKAELNAIPDALGLNMYPGGYGGESTDLGREIEDWRTANGRSCVAISEYGAGGSLGQPMPSPDYRPQPSGRCHPVDYQLKHHQASWAAIKANRHVWGCFAWVMFDAGSDNRHEGARDGINDKGIVGFDHKTVKPSYKFYKSIWNVKE